MSNPEIIKPSGDYGVEAGETAGEQLKKVQEQLEKQIDSLEKHGEKVESARKETEAAFSKEAGSEKKNGGEPTARAAGHASKKQRSLSYDHTMKQIRSEMNASSRTFSKVIHNKTVEKASESIGATVARPNAVLAGSIAATFLTLFVFLIAKQYGYRLSGFETIGTFFLGWAMGLVFDYAKLLFAARRS